MWKHATCFVRHHETVMTNRTFMSVTKLLLIKCCDILLLQVSWTYSRWSMAMSMAAWFPGVQSFSPPATDSEALAFCTPTVTERIPVRRASVNATSTSNQPMLMLMPTLQAMRTLVVCAYRNADRSPLDCCYRRQAADNILSGSFEAVRFFPARFSWVLLEMGLRIDNDTACEALTSISAVCIYDVTCSCFTSVFYHVTVENHQY